MVSIRSWLLARLYDLAMRGVEKRGLGAWRAELLARVHGEVLELGAGTGLNLGYYPPDLERLVLTEPDPWMRRRLQRRLAAAGRGDVVAAGAEELPFAEASFDAVVATLVLCSVEDLAASLREVVRLLRPGGRFHFIEHVAAVNRPEILRWQRLLEPAWRFCCGNCHLTRRTAEAIAAAGLTIEILESGKLQGAPAVVRSVIRGRARKG